MKLFDCINSQRKHTDLGKTVHRFPFPSLRQTLHHTEDDRRPLAPSKMNGIGATKLKTRVPKIEQVLIIKALHRLADQLGNTGDRRQLRERIQKRKRCIQRIGRAADTAAPPQSAASLQPCAPKISSQTHKTEHLLALLPASARCSAKYLTTAVWVPHVKRQPQDKQRVSPVFFHSPSALETAEPIPPNRTEVHSTDRSKETSIPKA